MPFRGVTERGRNRRLASARRAALVAGLVVTLVLGTAVVIKWAPEWLVSKGALSPAQRAEDVGRVRTALLATLAGFIAVLGAYYTARTFALNRQGQITERFTRAIDQLGSQALDVRIGGLYALHRLSQESREDYVSIMEILAAYVRDHAPATRRAAGQTPGRGRYRDAQGRRGPRHDDRLKRDADPLDARSPATDVQVALGILTRPRDRGHPPPVIDLSLTDLSGARLQGVHLAGANLRGAQFADANLEYANLQGVALEGADMSTARGVDRAYFAGATYDADTAWPAGFDARASGAVKTGVPRRLVLCCDGTWARPGRIRVGGHPPTNVAKVAHGIVAADADGNPQKKHYLAGHSPGLRRVSQDIREGYRFLVDNYEPGDQIYLFGFSRGAYVARSIAGLVQVAGIVRREHSDRVPDAYVLYRSRTAQPRGIAARSFRSQYAHPGDDITFIGVWDTVGALGIPRSLRRARWSSGFHDVTLGTHVRAAYQALALDEHRRDFAPTLWQQCPYAANQTLEQVWFPGGHRDVGGGYRDTSLSDITLFWMTERASQTGLVFEWHPDEELADGRPFVASPNPLGPIHDERVGAHRLSPPYYRQLDRVDGGSVSPTVLTRLRAIQEYKPPNLERYLATKEAWPPQTSTEA